MVEYLQQLCSTRVIRHCVNVGAHIGCTALPIARCVQQVTAVEANPKTFEHLVKNVQLNGATNVRCINKALGNCNETSYLMSDGKICPVENINRVKNNSGGMHVFTSADILNQERSSCLVDINKTVAMTRLDDLHLNSVDLMVVDIEGSEHNFLLGAVKTIARCSPIMIIELWSDSKRRRENMPHSREEAIRQVCGLGYKVAGKLGEDDFIFEREREETTPTPQ